MKKINKINKIFIMFLMIMVVFMAGCSSQIIDSGHPGGTFETQTSTQKETIKIGVTVPLSGDLSFMGEGVKNSMLMAQEELGNVKYDYEIIFLDDQLDNKKALTNVQKLINVDKVDVVVSAGSGIGNVVSPITQENKVIHMNIGASDSTVAKGDYNFIHWTQPEQEVKKFVEELQKRNIRKVSVFLANQQGMIMIFDELKKQIQGTNIEIVSKEMFDMGTNDFRTQIIKAKQTNPQIHLLLTYSPEIELLTKQIKEQQITTPLTSIESFEMSDQINIFEGYWYINAAESSGEFIEKYENKYDSKSLFLAGNGYDVFNIIVRGFENAKTSRKVDVIEQLKEINNFKGAMGILDVDKDGIINSPAVVKQIENGKPIVIG